MRPGRVPKGFSLVEMLLVIVVIALALAGGVLWAYGQGRDARHSAQLVELTTFARATAVAEATSSAATGLSDPAGAYAKLGTDWLAANLDQRYLANGTLRVPVAGVGVEMSGVRSPWGPSPPVSLDVGRIRLSNVPSAMCPEIVMGLSRSFERVLINSNVALDTAVMPVSQSQILTWCNLAPVLTIEAFFA